MKLRSGKAGGAVDAFRSGRSAGDRLIWAGFCFQMLLDSTQLSLLQLFSDDSYTIAALFASNLETACHFHAELNLLRLLMECWLSRDVVQKIFVIVNSAVRLHHLSPGGSTACRSDVPFRPCRVQISLESPSFSKRTRTSPKLFPGFRQKSDQRAEAGRGVETGTQSATETVIKRLTPLLSPSSKRLCALNFSYNLLVEEFQTPPEHSKWEVNCIL